MHEPTRFGRYELRARLGRGGMGEVWEAVLHGPEGFRKPVALKLLRAPDGDAAAEQALVAEARHGALLRHPNVVGTYDLLRVGTRLAIAMELVRGAPLSALVRERPLPPGAVLDALVQACAGLEHVHRAGLVHRDVKPQNLLLDRTGLVKLADLGVARLQGTTRGAAGTAGYMPPEQLDGREDRRADLFALGVTAIVLATGVRPFGTGPQALVEVRRVEQVLDERLAPAEAAVPGLGAILRRCLCASPADRYGSAAELGTALAGLRARHRGTGLLERLAAARPDLAVEPSASLGTVVGSDVATVRLVRGNLPPARDRFVGRGTNVDALAGLVGDAPGLVTLLGPGGMGKTRLAVEAARAVEPRLLGGAWFFDLSEARTGAAMCAVVGGALGLALDRDPVDRVGFAIRGRGRALVILDNLEQVADAAAEVVVRWRATAPEATWLCTSRIPLGLRDERRVVVGPLADDEAVELFLARAVRPVPDGERDALSRLVAELDGMPLAIELAAARTRVVAVPEIRRRLGERLRLLAGGERDRPERQRSLRASLDGSFELLPAEARSALARLSVLEGPFLPETAAAVLGGPAFDRLAELADASLLRADAASGRFAMLKGVREYAAERLTGPERAEAERRHGEAFARHGSPEALATLHGRDGVERMRELAKDHEDLVAACRRAVARGDGPVAVATALAAAQSFPLRGLPGEEVALLEAVLARVADPWLEVLLADAIGRAGRRDEAVARLAALAADGVGTERLGHWLVVVGRVAEGRDVARDAVARLAEGDLRRLGLAWVTLARAENLLGRVEESRAACDEAEALFRDLGSVVDLARVHLQAGGLCLDKGWLEDAAAHLAASVRIWREVGDRRDEAVALVSLGICRAQAGEPGEARSCYERALAGARSAGDRATEGVALGNLGGLCIDQGLAEEAERHLRASIAICRETGERRFEGVALGNLAVHLVNVGRRPEAVPLFEEALALHREIGNRRSEGVVMTNYAGTLGAIGLRDRAHAMLVGALAVHREVENLRFEGIAVNLLGIVATQEGRWGDARAAFEAALALHRRTGNRQKASSSLHFLATVDLEEGRLDDARVRLEAAADELRAIGDERTLAIALQKLAEVHLVAGRTADARTLALEALAISRRAEDPANESDALLVLARVAAADGEPAAVASAREGVAIARRMEEPLNLALALVAQGEVERRAGDPEVARAALREAQAEAQKGGARPGWPVLVAIARETERLGGT